MSESVETRGTAGIPLRTLNRRLKTIVEGKTRGKPVQVWGGATKVIRSRKGFVHCRLLQGNHGLSCYVPRDVVRRLPFWIEDGQTLGVQGEVEVYAQWGELQIVARQVELQKPATEDDALESLKRHAYAAGWLDPARKRPLPRPPQAVGLVAGEQSRARVDVVGSLKDAGVAALVISEAARMQGSETADDVVSALATLNANPDVDVIVVARGGGSKPELEAFNDWDLAQAIVASRVPVVTAIGHREDKTLADMVADKSVPTPSSVGGALAGRPIPRWDETAEAQGDRRWDAVSVAVVGMVALLLALLARALGWW